MIKEIISIKNNTKGRIFLILFRTSSFFLKNRGLKVIGFPIRIFYKLVVQWFMGIDIPDATSIGFGFNVYHGQGLIINKATIIGRNVMVRHNTTIGVATENGLAPRIGDHVVIGANSVIIGNITIGDNSVIGAGSVVIKDVPSNSKAVGNPARIISNQAPSNFN